MTKYDVISIGSATTDVFAQTSSKFSQVKCGDKVLINKIFFEDGGSAVNSSIALSKLGLKVGFLGKLGKDYRAQDIINLLKKEKVHIINKNRSGSPTSYSFILDSSSDCDRIIYAYKGSSDDLETKDINWRAIKNTKWLYLGTMLNKSFQTIKKIVKFAHKHKIKILFNPSTYLARKGKIYLKNILKYTTVLVLNLQESQYILQTKTNNIATMVKSLRRLGPKTTIITDGPRGIYLYDGKYLCHTNPYKVKVVSTTGAGDAFTSGFLASYIKTKDLLLSIKIGMANAASVITHIGAQNKLLTYKQALKFIKTHKSKVDKWVCE